MHYTAKSMRTPVCYCWTCHSKTMTINMLFQKLPLFWKKTFSKTSWLQGIAPIPPRARLDYFVVKAGKISLKSMAIDPEVAQRFHWKSPMWTSWWRSRESQGITKVVMMYPLGTMNVWTTSHVNLSKSCWDILIWIKVADRFTDKPGTHGEGRAIRLV